MLRSILKSIQRETVSSGNVEPSVDVSVPGMALLKESEKCWTNIHQRNAAACDSAMKSTQAFAAACISARFVLADIDAFSAEVERVQQLAAVVGTLQSQIAEACTQLARLEQDLDAIARRDEEAALMRWERDQQAEWASIQASKRGEMQTFEKDLQRQRAKEQLAIRQDFLQLAAEHARNAAKSAGPPAPVSRPSAALPATATPLESVQPRTAPLPQAPSLAVDSTTTVRSASPQAVPAIALPSAEAQMPTEKPAGTAASAPPATIGNDGASSPCEGPSTTEMAASTLPPAPTATAAHREASPMPGAAAVPEQAVPSETAVEAKPTEVVLPTETRELVEAAGQAQTAVLAEMAVIERAAAPTSAMSKVSTETAVPAVMPTEAALPTEAAGQAEEIAPSSATAAATPSSGQHPPDKEVGPQ